MAEEKILTVPLRRDFINVSKNRRANKAVDSLRTFLSVHNKVSKEKVKISRSINEFLWRRGAQKPPSRVKVLVSFDGEFLKAMLPEEKQKPKKEEKPKETKPEKEKQEPAKEAKEKAKPEKESTEKKEAKKQVSEKPEQPAEAKDKKQEKKQ